MQGFCLIIYSNKVVSASVFVKNDLFYIDIKNFQFQNCLYNEVENRWTKNNFYINNIFLLKDKITINLLALTTISF